MASTFTDALVLEKQATGENDATWGDKLNAVLDQIDDVGGAVLSKSVAGSSDVTLSSTEALHATQIYTGLLTGNINVIMPDKHRKWLVFNNTTGAFTLTVKTSAGTGIVVAQPHKAHLYCDGTNVETRDAGIDSIAALATLANRMIYTTALDVYDVTELSVFARTILDDADAAAVLVTIGALGTGKHTLWIPAAAMSPTSSNGCSPLASVETTAGRPDLQVLDYVASADEAAQFQIAMPKSWNLGTVTFQVFWTVSAAVTTGIAMALEGVFVPDNSTIDVAYGTPVVVTDDAQSQTEEQLVSAESGNVTIAGTPADDGMCFFRLFRDVSDGNDDMTQDMRLIGIKLFMTLDAATDA